MTVKSHSTEMLQQEQIMRGKEHWPSKCIVRLPFSLFTCLATTQQCLVTPPQDPRVVSLHQGAKKVVSDSPRLVDFAIGLVNSVLNLPTRQAKIFRRIKITKVLQDKCFKFLINSCGPKVTLMKWNLHKQDEVSHYMSDGTHKVKADIEKNFGINVARD